MRKLLWSREWRATPRLLGCDAVNGNRETVEGKYWIWSELGEEAYFVSALLKCGLLVAIAMVKVHGQVQQTSTQYLQCARSCVSILTTLGKDIITIPCLQMEAPGLSEVRWRARFEPRSSDAGAQGRH